MHISVPITLILSIHDLLFKSKKRTIKSNNGAQSMRTETRYAQITHVYFFSIHSFNIYLRYFTCYCDLIFIIIIIKLNLLSATREYKKPKGRKPN